MFLRRQDFGDSGEVKRMKFRLRHSAAAKLQLPIVPLMAVGFQLLMFLLLTQRTIRQEAGFEENLPTRVPSRRSADESNPPLIRVSLRSDAAGNLTQLALGSKSLGNDDAAFDRLSREILQLIVQPGNPLTQAVEVEIDADYEVQYQHILRAVSYCTGRVDPQTRQLVRYVEKIKFAPPHRPNREIYTPHGQK